MRKIVLSLVALNLLASNNIDEIIQSINKDLKKYEIIATKTKSNEHYQPYIVSVLKNKTLVQLGCTTLLDALKLIPNLDVSSDNINYKSLIFRGSNPTSFGQSKLFIDGVLVNNIYSDGYSEYLDMPIELIKRVEVIRGPGNKSQDIATYAGSIHIITYNENISNAHDSIFIKGGSYDFFSAGFKKAYIEKDLKIFTDFYYKSDNKTVFVANDGLASGMFNFSNFINNTPLSSSANVPLYLRNFSLGFTVKYKNFYLKSRIFEHKSGTAFGINYIPSKEENYLKTPNHFAVIGYKKYFKYRNIDMNIGINLNSLDTKAKLAPDGLKLPSIVDPSKIVTFPNGIYGKNIAKQRNIFHSFTYEDKSLKKHNIKLSYYISKTTTTDIVSKITDRVTGVGIVDYSDILPFFDKNAYRNSFKATISDKYNYSKKLQLLYGINFEKNTQLKSTYDPKFSLVYNLNYSNILKFLYSKSHRNPSWQELFTINNRARVGNRDLKAEKIETYEISHIKHFANDDFIQTTLFYIINKNQIHNFTPNNQYVNNKKTNNLYGIELEYKTHFLPQDEVYFNISYTNGKNSNDNLSLASKVLAKGYYIYNYSQNLSFSGIVEYKSSKSRILNDPRDSIPAETIMDLAINYQNFYKKYNLNLSIKNIFNTKVVYPSKPKTYEDDYPNIGRNFVISFSRKF